MNYYFRTLVYSAMFSGVFVDSQPSRAYWCAGSVPETWWCCVWYLEWLQNECMLNCNIYSSTLVGCLHIRRSLAYLWLLHSVLVLCQRAYNKLHKLSRAKCITYSRVTLNTTTWHHDMIITSSNTLFCLLLFSMIPYICYRHQKVQWSSESASLILG